MTNLSMKISLRPDIILPNMTGVRLYPHINCMFNLLSVRSYTVIPVPMVNAVVFFQLLCAPKELGQQRGCSWPHVLLLLIYLLSEMNFIFFLNALRVLIMVHLFFTRKFLRPLSTYNFCGIIFSTRKVVVGRGGERREKRERDFECSQFCDGSKNDVTPQITVMNRYYYITISLVQSMIITTAASYYTSFSAFSTHAVDLIALLMLLFTV